MVRQLLNVQLNGFFKLGRFMSRILMPNLSVFLAWGLLNLLLPLTTGAFHDRLIQIDQMMVYLLMPILLGYSGAKLIHARAGVVGGMATLGVIASATIPQVLGALIIGPLTGYALRLFDRKVLPKIKPGYEMLVHNLSAGSLGALFCCFGLFVVGPLVTQMSYFEGLFVTKLVQLNLLPLIHVVLEPLKILFLNNTINHGILTPLGLEIATQKGTSLLFLLEVNPGPGLGVLLAFVFFGPKKLRGHASSGLLIQGVGGLHEIYFPFVWLNPWLFLAVILGGMSGTFVFQFLQVGLTAPVSPGSVIMILLNAPATMVGGVFLGMGVSLFVSFLIASLALQQKIFLTEESIKEIQVEKVKKIIFACEAGMGSSAMGASLLKKELAKARLNLPVSHFALQQVPNDENSLIVVQKELLQQAQKQAPQAQIYPIQQFLDEATYQALVSQWKAPIIHEERDQPKEKTMVDLTTTFPYQKVVFLYEAPKRGTQTIAVDFMQKAAKKTGYQGTIMKSATIPSPLEPTTLLVLTKDYLTQVNLPKGTTYLLIKDYAQTSQYEKWLKGEDLHVLVAKRSDDFK